MPRVLFYADARSLSAYLGGAAMLEPAVVEARCRDLRLVPEGGEGAPARAALYFEDDRLQLPEPEGSGELRPAELDVDSARLVARRGRRRDAYAVQGELGAARPLAQALAPVPWEAGPRAAEELLFLSPPGPVFAQLVAQHLELGRNELRFASVRTEAGERMLLEVSQPSWFLLERWQDLGPGLGVTLYRRLVGLLGPRRVFLEWGCAHPLERWLAEPQDPELLLLIDREGRHRTLRLGALQDVGQILDLDATRFPTLELVAAPTQERVQVALRLEGRPRPLDPALWLLPSSLRQRLEDLLAQTPEEELRNLLVAYLQPPAGEPLFAVREVLTGRAPRLLPLGERAYAPLPGLPNLLVPCDRSLAPPLSNDRYARAFALRPGELTVLDEQQGRVHVTRLPERAFHPVEAIIDFVFSGQAQALEEVLLRAPFDLGVFAEEDLVPTPRAERPREEEPRRRPAKPVPAGPQTAPAKRRGGLMDKLLKPFRAPAPAPSAAQAAAAQDPRREEILRLQRELVLEAPTPDRWLELSRLLLADEQDEEFLRAVESALWELPDPRAQEVWSLLGEALGAEGGAGAPRDTLELYRRVFAYQRQASAGDAQRYRSATEAIYEALREHQDRLRKRTRWLLWRAVLGETGDGIEVERQREAILSDLVVRGIEEREVPAFVHQLLLEHYGQRAATGSGASSALAFLDQAQRFAASVRHPAYQAEALAQVAWAFAELGQGERALEFARLAERQAGSKEGAPPHDAWRARAMARVGTVRERVQGPGQGRAPLEESLAELVRLLPDEPVRRQSQEMVDARKGLVAWLACAADAWRMGDRAEGDLLERACALLESRPPNDRSQIIHDAAEALTRLGLAGRVRALAWRLLQPDELRRAREAVVDYQHPEDAYRVHVQNSIEALELYRPGEPVSEPEATTILRLLRTQPAQLLDEFSIGPLRIALRGSGASAWGVVDELSAELTQRGLPYEAHLVRIAGLWRLAELRDRQRGAELLEATLAEAWRLTDSPKKPTHRIITRLVQLVPAFGMRDRGLRLLLGVNQRTQAQGQEVYFRNELLLSTAIAGSKLGDSQAAFELIQETAQLAMGDLAAASEGGRVEGPSWLLFETLDECVNGAVDLGESRRGLELVQAVAETARGALGRSRDAPGRGSEGPYFYCRTLIRCGRAALALGDADAATGHFAAAFAHLHALSNWDLTEVLQEAAVTAGQLEGARRYQLAGQVVEAAKEPVAGGSQDRFAVDLVSQIARDMVRGESAFASALKRWKGREERSIRDRVAHEQVGA